MANVETPLPKYVNKEVALQKLITARLSTKLKVGEFPLAYQLES